jgi:hypothetical protein
LDGIFYEFGELLIVLPNFPDLRLNVYKVERAWFRGPHVIANKVKYPAIDALEPLAQFIGLDIAYHANEPMACTVEPQLEPLNTP